LLDLIYGSQADIWVQTYLGHIQTETPYYQPDPVAPLPFTAGKSFPADPSFADCKDDACKEAWALRVIDSSTVTIHSAGMYSFFSDYYQDCIQTENCQDRIMEVKGSQDVVLFNIFTIASVQVATGIKYVRFFSKSGSKSY
jgi:hypothetical protein